MKIAILTLILVCIAAVTIGAQEQKGSCPKIIVEAPETIMGNDITFNVSAKFEGASLPTTNFDWTVVRDGGTTTLVSRPSIKLETGRPKDSELIFTIAQPSDLLCKGFGVSKTLVVPNVGSPLVIDQYQAVRWADERPRLDNAAMQMKDMPDSELIIHVAFAASDRNASKREYLKRLVDYLFSRWKMEANRITFAISTTTDRRTTKLQPVRSSLMTEFPFFDALVVRAEDRSRLSVLFASKN